MGGFWSVRKLTLPAISSNPARALVGSRTEGSNRWAATHRIPVDVGNFETSRLETRQVDVQVVATRVRVGYSEPYCATANRNRGTDVVICACGTVAALNKARGLVTWPQQQKHKILAARIACVVVSPFDPAIPLARVRICSPHAAEPIRTGAGWPQARERPERAEMQV